jgi:DNA polymerase
MDGQAVPSQHVLPGVHACSVRPCTGEAQAVVMGKVRTIGIRIDIESKSRTDIKYGVYRYTEDPEFGVLVIAYSPMRRHPGGAIRLGPPRLVDLANPDPQFIAALSNPRFQKHAFNANFERIALSRWLGMGDGDYLDPAGWYCTAVLANVNGVFGTLEEVARALRSPVNKDAVGKRLINLFSKPDKKDKGGQRFHSLSHQPEDSPFVVQGCWCGGDHSHDFTLFEEYCKQDVVTEAVVGRVFPPIPPAQQAEYEADQRINDRGIRHFKALSKAAVEQVAVEKDRLMDNLRIMTGIDNPNSGPQFNAWLETQGYPMQSLDKAHREEALVDPLIPETVAEALKMKGAASLSSVTKHKAALDTRCRDGRIRGSLRYYGAHTGREAGRGIQPQNLPRAQASKADMRLLLDWLAGERAPEIAKGTVRSSLVPARGHVFVTADYNAIEARTLGWVTGEVWVNEEFRGAGKIYEATAATMFNVNKDTLVASLKACGKCGVCRDCELRARGKVSNLALGYAGGAGALVTMGAEAAGIDIGNYGELHAIWVALGRPGKFHEWEKDTHDYPELIRLRDLYRAASPETARFWKLCAKAWDLSSAGRGARWGANGVVSMVRDGRHNRIVLPSGRSIWYRMARSHFDPHNPERIDRRTFIGKSSGVGHVRTDTHGGKLTENINQAIARDVLFDLIMRIEEQVYQPGRIVFHVHDEVVLEVPEKHADQRLADVLGLMEIAPDWAPGLVVKGEGSIMERYAK